MKFFNPTRNKCKFCEEAWDKAKIASLGGK